MEARQFRRFAEDRFAHDAAEIAELHDAIARRDADVRSLSAQLRACRARLLQLGFLSPSSLPSSPKGGGGRDHHPFTDDHGCPSVRRIDHPDPASDVGTPRTHHLLNRMPSRAADKGVISATPRRSRHVRALSGDSSFAFNGGIALADEFPFMVEHGASDRDDDCDRVCTVDAVHGVPVATPDDCCHFEAPSEVGFVGRVGAWSEEQEIQKLSARLQALEADRESMRDAIMSMGAEKAQVVMLKEIAQQICKDSTPFPVVPSKMESAPQSVVVAQRKVVKRQPSVAKLFIVTVIKWIASVFSRQRKSDRIKYPFGLCGSYVGLMLLLDRPRKHRNRRFLKKI